MALFVPCKYKLPWVGNLFTKVVLIILFENKTFLNIKKENVLHGRQLNLGWATF